MFQELKETTLKELKESIMTMYHQEENSSKKNYLKESQNSGIIKHNNQSEKFSRVPPSIVDLNWQKKKLTIDRYINRKYII